MRTILQAIFLSLVVLSIAQTSDSSAGSINTQKALMLRYSIMDEATRNADTKSFASVLAENYEEFDQENHMLRRSEVIEKFNAFFGKHKRQFKSKIVSAKINKTSAKITCQRIDIDEGLLWKRTDLWKLSNGTWFLTQSRQDGFTILKGGQAQKMLMKLK